MGSLMSIFTQAKCALGSAIGIVSDIGQVIGGVFNPNQPTEAPPFNVAEDHEACVKAAETLFLALAIVIPIIIVGLCALGIWLCCGRGKGKKKFFDKIKGIAAMTPLGAKYLPLAQAAEMVQV